MYIVYRCSFNLYMYQSDDALCFEKASNLILGHCSVTILFNVLQKVKDDILVNAEVLGELLSPRRLLENSPDLGQLAFSLIYW